MGMMFFESELRFVNRIVDEIFADDCLHKTFVDRQIKDKETFKRKIVYEKLVDGKPFPKARNLQIALYGLARNNMSLAAVKYGISRERVRQITNSVLEPFKLFTSEYVQQHKECRVFDDDLEGRFLSKVISPKGFFVVKGRHNDMIVRGDLYDEVLEYLSNSSIESTNNQCVFTIGEDEGIPSDAAYVLMNMRQNMVWLAERGNKIHAYNMNIIRSIALRIGKLFALTDAQSITMPLDVMYNAIIRKRKRNEHLSIDDFLMILGLGADDITSRIIKAREIGENKIQIFRVGLHISLSPSEMKILNLIKDGIHDTGRLFEKIKGRFSYQTLFSSLLYSPLFVKTEKGRYTSIDNFFI